jgi:pilus assembly protein CpaF
VSTDERAARRADYRQLLAASWRARHGSSVRRKPARRGHDATTLTARHAAAAKLGPLQQLRREIYETFLREIESRGSAALTEEQARERIRHILDDAAQRGAEHQLSAAERTRLEDEVAWEISGLGPLGPLFIDPTVSDVLVNGPSEVWVDRFGRLERTAVRFDDDEHLLRLLRRIASKHGRHVDEASPYVDVRMPGGSRLHAIIPPLAKSPIVSIRHQRATPFRMRDLCAFGTLSEEMADVLSAVVQAGLNVLISGGTASGKTTLLNVVGGFIPTHERVVTIEQTVELHFDHPHVVTLEARLPNIEGRGEVTLRDLVRNALRMRPDRIIVGEVRGPEVFDMLQAMNTGHEGSLTTVHANNPEDALRRLESLVLMGGFDLPSRAIRELLGAAFDLVVHISRFADGSRRVTSIGQVVADPGELSIRELYRFDQSGGRDGRGGAGRHAATGAATELPARLERRGFPLAATNALVAAQKTAK